jgi:hypothetical protein
MTLVGTVSNVTASIHEPFGATELTARDHDALTLEVYSKLYDRFGALSDFILGKLAEASATQLSDMIRMLGDVDSMQQIASHFGWEITRGGEGNFPMADGIVERAHSVDEEQRFETRLASLQSAQQARESNVQSNRRPQPFVEESEFVCI